MDAKDCIMCVFVEWVLYRMYKVAVRMDWSPDLGVDAGRTNGGLFSWMWKS